MQLLCDTCCTTVAAVYLKHLLLLLEYLNSCAWVEDSYNLLFYLTLLLSPSSLNYWYRITDSFCLISWTSKVTVRISVYVYKLLKGESQSMGSDSFQWYPVTRHHRHKQKHGKFHLNMKKIFLALNTAAQIGSGVSSGDIKSRRLFWAWATAALIGFGTMRQTQHQAFHLKVGDLNKHASHKYPRVMRDFYSPLKLPKAGEVQDLQLNCSIHPYGI